MSYLDFESAVVFVLLSWMVFCFLLKIPFSLTFPGTLFLGIFFSGISCCLRVPTFTSVSYGSCSCTHQNCSLSVNLPGGHLHILSQMQTGMKLSAF